MSKFKFIGTEEQLIKNGFKPYFDEDYKCITSYLKECKIVENEIMVAWERNCALEKNEIGYRFDYEEVDINEVKYLIDKGLIKELTSDE